MNPDIARAYVNQALMNWCGQHYMPWVWQPVFSAGAGIILFNVIFLPVMSAFLPWARSKATALALRVLAWRMTRKLKRLPL